MSAIEGKKTMRCWAPKLCCRQELIQKTGRMIGMKRLTFAGHLSDEKSNDPWICSLVDQVVLTVTTKFPSNV